MNNNEIFVRILQQLTTIRGEIIDLKEKVGALQNQFNQQFTPQNALTFEHNSEVLTEDPVVRSRYTSALNRYGRRDIGPNPTNQPQATMLQKYNSLLQHLHEAKSEGNTPLDKDQLDKERKKLHNAALKIVRSHFQVMSPNVTRWSNVEPSNQMYYCLLLEEKILNEHNWELFRCKKSWAARSLLYSAYKAFEKQRRAAVLRLGRETNNAVAEGRALVNYNI